MSSKSSRTRRPVGNRRVSRGPGRTSGTESGEGLTGLPPELMEAVQDQSSALRTMAANRGLGEPVLSAVRIRPLDPQEADPAVFDPDLAFGLPPDLADPLPAGATVADPDGVGAWDSEEPTTREGSTGSSRAPGVVNPLAAKGRAKAFTILAAAAVEAVSGLLNERLALDEADETWLADEHDIKAVGDPAGRIIARKLPLPDGTDTNDLVDLIEIAIGGAGYLLKNATARVRLIRERRRALREAAVYQEA